MYNQYTYTGHNYNNVVFSDNLVFRLKFDICIDRRIDLACPNIENLVTLKLERYLPPSKFCDECGYDLNEAKKDDFSPPDSNITEKVASKSPSARSFLDGERKHVTVLFSDLSGYTAMSDRLDPEEVKDITTNLKLENIQWFEGHAYPYSQNMPYFPIIDLLNKTL
jgi:hypothetical protein